MESATDTEIAVIKVVVGLLLPLDKRVLNRVLRYLCDRFDFDPGAP